MRFLHKRLTLAVYGSSGNDNEMELRIGVPDWEDSRDAPAVRDGVRSADLFCLCWLSEVPMPHATPRRLMYKRQPQVLRPRARALQVRLRRDDSGHRPRKPTQPTF